MIEGINEYIKLNAILETLDEEQLNKLYARVFNTDDGKLIMQDLANRCYVHVPIDMMSNIQWAEGARSVFLSIQTRLANAIKGKKGR